jgi:hypothetical protein
MPPLMRGIFALIAAASHPTPRLHTSNALQGAASCPVISYEQ